MTQSLELLYPQQAVAAWEKLEPLFAKEGNDCSADEVLALLRDGMCGVFAYYEDAQLKLALALQFSQVGTDKHAEIFALGGEGLMRFRKAYWPHVVSWLKANRVKQVDVHGSERMLRIYRAKFGFKTRREYASMTL
jgi:hypothetical protein